MVVVVEVVLVGRSVVVLEFPAQVAATHSRQTAVACGAVEQQEVVTEVREDATMARGTMLPSVVVVEAATGMTSLVRKVHSVVVVEGLGWMDPAVVVVLRDRELPEVVAINRGTRIRNCSSLEERPECGMMVPPPVVS